MPVKEYALQRKSNFCIPILRIPRHNFHIHVSVSDLYIPRIGPHIFLQQNRQIDSGKYINRSQTHECGNWDWGRAAQFLFWEYLFRIFGIASLQCVSAKILFKSGLTFKITHQWDGRGQRRWRRYCRRWKGRHLGPKTQEIYKKGIQLSSRIHRSLTGE
jgi:hypothetical protein